jgi:hypothetical protein
MTDGLCTMDSVLKVHTPTNGFRSPRIS